MTCIASYNYNLNKNIMYRFQRLLKVLATSLFFIVLGAELSGCTREASSESVETVSAKLFDSIQKKDFDKTLSFYAEDFFNLQPRAAWKKHLIMVNQKLGTLKKVKLKRQNVSTVFSGRRFVFVFSNQYEKGLAQETVIFFQHVSKPDIKIQSHKIESSLIPGSRSHR